MRIVGLISGTSVDGIDAALVDVQGQGYDVSVELLACRTHPYPPRLRQAILGLCAGKAVPLKNLAELDDAVAHEFVLAAQAVMVQGGPAELVASHGQTVFHRPACPSAALADSTSLSCSSLGYSLQLGRGAVMAQQLGIPTASDFRRADIEAGGQGAPLVPLVDLCLFGQPEQHRCVQNIGGIGNVAYLPPWNRQTQTSPPKVLGWDTGPGNSLIDIAVGHFSEGAQAYDRNGQWAARGQPCMALVNQWLAHPYLAQYPPKSTGRELFGWEFFRQCWAEAQQHHLKPADLIASLTEFTAASIAQSYRDFLPHQPAQVLVCGGGSYNPYLLGRLQHYLDSIAVTTTDAVGISADYKEAIAFALLGFWRWHGVPSNLPTVTGAQSAVVLGQLNLP
jgi:anhydro-N-acetylmuramic acid kinase